MDLVFGQSSSNSFNYTASPIGWVLNLLFLGLGIYAAVDASKYPDYVWEQTGQNKLLWQILCPVVGFCCGCFGLIPVGIYFLNIKKKLDEAQAGGGYNPMGYGYPQGPGGYPGGGAPPMGYPPAGGGYPPASGAPSYPPVGDQGVYPPASGAPGDYPPADPQPGWPPADPQSGWPQGPTDGGPPQH